MNRIVDRKKWLEARRALLREEKQHMQEMDNLTRKRQQLPWMQIQQDYVFQGEKGEVSLGDLFEGRSQLIIYHFMFAPSWEQGCVSCSFWMDNFDGIEEHLAARDISFAAISKAPIEKLAAFKKRMGWNINWVSSFENSFNQDFNVSFGPDHDPDAAVFYNFNEKGRNHDEEAHGASVFYKDKGGALYRTYSTYGRGLEMINLAYRYMDLTPKGRNEAAEGNPMAWLRHHDSY